MDLYFQHPTYLCGFLRPWNFITFVRSVPYVVATASVVIMCIYSCYYEYTSYTLVLFLCMSHWCDNINYDLRQHVRRLLKWRDDADGNKFWSIIISFTPLPDTVSMCTCHYMLFPFLLLHADSFWIPQYCDMQNGCFCCWCKSHCSNISSVLLTKRKYQIPFKIPTKISDKFSAFPWSLQTNAEPEIIPWIMSVPLLSMSFSCLHSLSSRKSLLNALQLLETLKQLSIQPQQQCSCW